jgi:1,4-dihydroxy-2-naphthoyl-CoA synthase
MAGERYRWKKRMIHVSYMSVQLIRGRTTTLFVVVFLSSVLLSDLEKEIRAGKRTAAELSFTGRLVEEEEALALGIFLEVSEPEGLLSRALALAAQIAAKPPHEVRITKS